MAVEQGGEEKRTAILFYGDWQGDRGELPFVRREVSDISKRLRQKGTQVEQVHEEVADFVQAILKHQNAGESVRLIHYSGHMELDFLTSGKDNALPPGALKNAFGLELASRPIVFLNGCGYGIRGRVPEATESLVREFLACGAAACIITEFSVFETTAYYFARTFYGHLLRGCTVGEALQRTQLDVKNKKRSNLAKSEYDITRYFYCVYGDPMVRLM